MNKYIVRSLQELLVHLIKGVEAKDINIVQACDLFSNVFEVLLKLEIDS